MIKDIIEKCKKFERPAQKILYDHLASKLYYTCKRYLKNEEEIAETLSDSFYIIFTKIHQLKDWKLIEAWAKKITVNQCLNSLKRRLEYLVYLDDVYNTEANRVSADEHEKKYDKEDILYLINLLPEGCKTVFNLYAIEGYSHKEIANMLNISEGTSKSQLNFARKKLQEMLITKSLFKTEEYATK